MYAHNLFAAFFISACVLLSANGKECIYDDRGECMHLCPPNTYSYVAVCGPNEDMMTQRTCRNPVARAVPTMCDHSRCDCKEPELWDEAAQKCVMKKDCSDQSKVLYD